MKAKRDSKNYNEGQFIGPYRKPKTPKRKRIIVNPAPDILLRIANKFPKQRRN